MNLPAADLPKTAVDGIEHVAEVLYAYGVYALLALFLYFERKTSGDYQQAVARKNATELRHYRRVHTTILSVTVALAAVVAAVWLYPEFVHRHLFYWGSISGLDVQPTPPKAAGDPPEIEESLTSMRHEDSLFVAGEGANLSWVLRSDVVHTDPLLAFRHICSSIEVHENSQQLMRSDTGSPDVLLSASGAGEASVSPKPLPLSRMFRIPLTKYPDLAREDLQLQYNRVKEDHCTQLGTLSVLHQSAWIPLALEPIGNPLPAPAAAAGDNGIGVAAAEAASTTVS